MLETYVLAIIALSLLVILVLVTLWKKSQTTPQQIAQEIFIEGLLSLASGDEKVAYQKFRSVVQQDTENVDAYLMLGNLLRKRGKPEKALQIHKELTIRPSLTDAKRIQVQKSRADDSLAAGQQGQASEMLEELWRKEKDSLELGEKLLAAYERLGKWEEAVVVEERLAKIRGGKSSPRAALYKVMEGIEDSKKDDYHRARLDFKEALNYDDKCVPAYLYLGEAYAADKRLEDAVDFWKKLLELVPQAGYLIYPRLEKALYDLGRFGEMTHIYQEVLEKNPLEVRAMLALANIYQKKGNLNLSLEILREILEVKPDFYPALGSLVLLYCQSGKHQEAKTLVEEHGLKDGFLNSQHACQSCGEISATPPWRCLACGRVNVLRW